jgi:preprotein translocase subunit SecE
MNSSIWIVVWVVVVGTAFAVLWRKGQLARLAAYVSSTREELRKCTWPTVDELKGSTAVVAISILLLGGFVVVTDFFLTWVVQKLT